MNNIIFPKKKEKINHRFGLEQKECINMELHFCQENIRRKEDKVPVTKQNAIKTDYCHGCDREMLRVDPCRPCLSCIADLSTLYCSQTEE